VKCIFNIFILFSAFTFLFLGSGKIYGQVSGDLEKKKKENIQKLAYSKSLLEKTEQSKKTSINQFNLIKKNIELRSEVIENINDELSFLKSDIEANNLEVKEILTAIDIIKKDYANLIVGASRNLDSDYALMYIFSSQDFNQAYQRIKYLKYLARYRSELVDNLKNEEESLRNKNEELIRNKRKNESLLYEQRNELNSLDKDRKKSETVIKLLQSKESELKKEIANRERIQSEIEKEIRKIIEEEAAKAKRNNVTALTPAEKLISADFYKNMGRLPWPTEKGIITDRYGEHNHPVLKGIKTNSSGIDINTVEEAKICTVFEGEVTKVVAILGANYSVIVKHGEYRTVYQNLVNVEVKAGDKIKTKSVIGTVFTDQDNISKFHFEVWKGKSTIDPELWLSK